MHTPTFLKPNIQMLAKERLYIDRLFSVKILVYMFQSSPSIHLLYINIYLISLIFSKASMVAVSSAYVVYKLWFIYIQIRFVLIIISENNINKL